MSLYFLTMMALLTEPIDADYSSAKQCYGPDYTEMYPFYGIQKDLCCHAYYNTSDTKSLAITLSYGSTVFGEDLISEDDPDEGEHQICDPAFPAPVEEFHACSICLGFEDIFMADDWAKICPKYILTCKGPFMDTVTSEWPTPCFTVGDDDTDDINQIVGGNTDFTFKLLSSKAATEEIVQDLFISPFAITNALIMTMMAANGETLEQLMNVFELSSDDYEVFDSFNSVVDAEQHESPPTMRNRVINKLWINSMYDQVLDPQFLSDFDRFGTIESCDFMNHSRSETQRIEDEAKDLTHDLITNPLNNEQLSASTVMLFTNVMYMKATWKYSFRRNLTKTFTDDDGEKVAIDMMVSSARKFPHYDDGEVEVIELPFRDQFSEISFVMLRPSMDKYVNDGPASTIEFEKVLDRKKLNEYLDGLEAKDHFNVTLPYMEMYNMEDITESLEALGVEDVFDPKRADLRNLTIPRYQVYETSLNRQDYIKIGPHVLEMASFVTDGENDGDSTNQGKVQHADRPFVFLIIDRSINLILYAGRVTNPKGWMVVPIPSKKGGGGSRVGSVFLILLLVGSLSYLIIKYIYNRSVVGLSGMDAVPHIGLCRGCIGCIQSKIGGGMPVPGAQPKERYAPMINEMGL